MIEHRQEVIFLLDEYIKTQREWIHQTWIPDLDQWSSERQRLYWDGIVLGKFRERDPITMQTLEKEYLIPHYKKNSVRTLAEK